MLADLSLPKHRPEKVSQATTLQGLGISRD